MDGAFIIMMVLGGLVCAGLGWIALHSLPRPEKRDGDADSSRRSDRAQLVELRSQGNLEMSERQHGDLGFQATYLTLAQAQSLRRFCLADGACAAQGKHLSRCNSCVLIPVSISPLVPRRRQRTGHFYFAKTVH